MERKPLPDHTILRYEEARELAKNGEKTEAVQDFSESNKNAEYLAMLDRSQAQLLHGDVVVKSMEELEHMAEL